MNNKFFIETKKRGFLDNQRGHDRYFKELFNMIKDNGLGYGHDNFKLLGILPFDDEYDDNPEKIGHRIHYTCGCEIDDY